MTDEIKAIWTDPGAKELYDFYQAEIAEAYRIPPHMMQAMSDPRRAARFRAMVYRDTEIMRARCEILVTCYLMPAMQISEDTKP